MKEFSLMMTYVIPCLCAIGFIVAVSMLVYSEVRRKRILKQGLEQIKRSDMEENTEAIVAANRHFLETGEDLTEDRTAGEHVGTIEHFERILGRR